MVLMNGDWMSIVIGIISVIIGIIAKKHISIGKRLLSLYDLLHSFLELEMVQMEMLTKVRKYMEDGKLTPEEMEELRALFQRKTMGIERVKQKVHEVISG